MPNFTLGEWAIAIGVGFVVFKVGAFLLARVVQAFGGER